MSARLKLKRDERIIAVVPEYAHGPGWSNSPLWVYIAGNGLKTLRTVCIQPHEQTAEQRALFAPGAAMACALVRSVAVKEVPGFSGEP